MFDSTYYTLGSKANFNKALRHFYKVSEVVDGVDTRENLADILNLELDEEEVQSAQILPIVGAVIKDKFHYTYEAFDIPVTINDFTKIVNVTSKWTALDLVIVYFNPNGSVFVINPKNENHWNKVRELSSDHLIVIYSKYLKNEDGNDKIEKESIKAMEALLIGKDVFANKDFIDASYKPKAQPVQPPQPVQQMAAVGGGQRRSTPKYSVQVTNELFHNGNVESWKKIIESFKLTHPTLDVIVFYEGELINDLNSLFKWGKVKHHGLIFFQVVGENIKDVSKLQKYLFEGASPRFEQFLKGSVGQVLNLF
ncbi:MAG: hypothetical protein JW982_15020 [Spirochaetes bacterium]|nr:hypothetical protein [Spirochaetota bacterium]